MRKQDLREGVIYAFSERTRPWHYDAVILLDVTRLYERQRYGPSGWFQMPVGKGRPQTSRVSRNTQGYLAVTGTAADLKSIPWRAVRHEFERLGTQYAVADRLMYPQSIENIARTLRLPKSVQLMLVTNLAHLKGEYQGVIDAQERHDRMAREHSLRVREERARAEARAERTVGNLRQAGLGSASVSGFHGSSVTISIEDAERLSSALAEAARLSAAWHAFGNVAESAEASRINHVVAEELENALFVLQRKDADST